MNTDLSPIVCRPAAAADLGAIAKAERAVFADAWSENALASHLAGECNISLIAESGGVFVGYLLGVLLPPEGEIWRVAVLPEYRGRGIGESLVRAFLPREGCCFLEVRESNLPAVRLYEKVGFLPVGRRKNYYKAPVEDALLYRKDIGTEYDTDTGI